jgi:hypothetical protein
MTERKAPSLAFAALAATVIVGSGHAAVRADRLSPAMSQAPADAFLGWSRGDATDLVAGMRRVDRVGSRMSVRGLKTDRAVNYKMRATWLTPDVIRATARALQLDERLTAADARRLVAEAEAASDTVVLVELDPHEGSGVIPLDWIALLQPRGLPAGDPGAARGTVSPKLRDVRALNGLFKRDYAYDAFWVAFTLKLAERTALFGPQVTEVELVVNIRGQEGVVSWPVPASVRTKLPLP